MGHSQIMVRTENLVKPLMLTLLNYVEFSANMSAWH